MKGWCESLKGLRLAFQSLKNDANKPEFQLFTSTIISGNGVQSFQKWFDIACARMLLAAAWSRHSCLSSRIMLFSNPSIQLFTQRHSILCSNTFERKL